MAMKVFLKKWVKALRSGKFSQTIKTLKDDKGYCCLGVACLLKAREEAKKSGKQRGLRAYQDPNHEYAGNWLLPIEQQQILAKMNDKGSSFIEIADFIEREFL